MNAPINDPGRRCVGIISDTHGRLFPETERAMAGVNAIIHAGDIGAPDILVRLGRIAPVFAVRGNMDGSAWSRHLPETDVVQLGGATFYVLHDINRLDLDPQAAGFKAVISGHTHRAASEQKNGVLYVNPGSASLPKFNDSPSVARIDIRDDRLAVTFIDLG